MEIYFDISHKNGSSESITATIVQYTQLATPKNLLLIAEDTLQSDNHPKAMPLISIRKVQFLAAIDTDYRIQGVAAFYIDEFAELSCHLLSGVPENYAQRSAFKLVDYASYQKLCSMTGEQPLNLIEYYRNSYGGRFELNTVLDVDGKYLNRDKQNVFLGRVKE